MKKYFILLIIFSIIVITPIKVRAEETMHMNIVGESTFDKTIELNIEVSNLDEYDGFFGMTANLEYDKNELELVNIKGKNDFEVSYNGENKKILLLNPKGIKESKNILLLKFQKKNLEKDKEATVKITNIVASDGNKDIQLQPIEAKIKTITNQEEIKETNNNKLPTITINGKKVELKKDELIYNMIVDYQTEEITIKLEDNNIESSLKEETKKLEVGRNEIEITTTDENGIERTYSLDITREGKNEKNKEEDLFITSNKKNKLDIKKYILIIPIAVLIIIVLKKKKG